MPETTATNTAPMIHQTFCASAADGDPSDEQRQHECWYIGDTVNQRAAQLHGPLRIAVGLGSAQQPGQSQTVDQPEQEQQRDGEHEEHDDRMPQRESAATLLGTCRARDLVRWAEVCGERRDVQRFRTHCLIPFFATKGSQ